MAVGTAWRSSTAIYDHPEFAPSARPQRLLAGAALICIAFACSWTLFSNLVGIANHAIEIGMAVEASFEPATDAVTLVKFKPVATT